MVTDAKTGLRCGLILLGGFPKPPHRLHLILGHALAIPIADPQTILSFGEVLLGRFAPPAHRFDLVLRHASAVGVTRAQIALSPGVPKDQVEAVSWWRKAAEQNLAEAQYGL